MNARATAIANNDRAIEESQSRAIAAREAERRPRNALEAMAQRLEVSPAGLKDTLLSTVFQACRNDSEFIALTVVSNAYGLNPLTKEIYAFPAKGGGIVPMVSVDGWIRIMNEHPQFDGIEFDYVVDQKGNVEAIEAIIYRKDRSHPTKVIEYLEECRRNTEPWKMMPRRMLRNRALIQGARVAFGFSGIVAEGDEDMIEPIEVRARAIPDKRTLAEELGDEIPDHNAETGEVIEEEQGQRDERGMTEVDEETARQLDAGEAEQEDEVEVAEEGAEEADETAGAEEESLTDKWLTDLRSQIENANSVAAVNLAGAEWDKNRVAYPDETITEFDNLLKAAYKRVRAAQGGR